MELRRGRTHLPQSGINVWPEWFVVFLNPSHYQTGGQEDTQTEILIVNGLSKSNSAARLKRINGPWLEYFESNRKESPSWRDRSLGAIGNEWLNNNGLGWDCLTRRIIYRSEDLQCPFQWLVTVKRGKLKQTATDLIILPPSFTSPSSYSLVSGATALQSVYSSTNCKSMGSYYPTFDSCLVISGQTRLLMGIQLLLVEVKW